MRGLCDVSMLWAIALGFMAVCQSNAAVFYVDPANGDMAGDGSARHPWKTVHEVFEGKLIQTRDARGRVSNPNAPVKAGDTILLRSGYHGEIYCRGAYNDDYITITAEEGHKPKVRRVFFAAAGKWIIRGLTVCPEFAPVFKPDRLIYVVDWGGPSADFVIENNTCHSTPDGSSWTVEQWNERVCYGISVIGERIKIRNNTLRYVNHGIVMTGDNITAEGNSIEHIGGDGIVCSADNASLIGNTIKYFYKINANHDDGIQFHRGRDKDTPIRNAIVQGNTVIAWDNGVRNPLVASPQGICNFDIPAINWRIENNLVLVRHHHGITIYGCRGGVIVNNLAYNPYGGDFLAGIALGTTHGKTTSQSTIVRNNLVDSEIGLAGTDNIADHNIVVRHPKQYFRDIENYDMRHNQGSPAIDAGNAELAPKTDMAGTKRPQGKAIDIGPYEFADASASGKR